MPLQVLQFRPGVSRESTSYANEGAWYQCDKIRFRSGLPEKLGGWVTYGTGTYLGTCRHFVEWVSLSGYYLLGVGTNLKYYILTGGAYFDITPIRATNTVAGSPFYPIYGTLGAAITDTTSTTITVSSGTAFTRVVPYVIKIGSEEIYVSSAVGTTLSLCVRGYNGTTASTHPNGATITSSYLVFKDASNGAAVNDFVTFSGATAFGPYSSAVLNKEYELFAADAGEVAFDTGIQSTSAVNGGGTVTAAYQISTGLSSTVVLGGWGAGPWGTGHGWGTGYSITGIEATLRLWSADNFGQNLFFNPRNGGIYYWNAATELRTGGAVTGRGVSLSDASVADVAASNIIVGNYYKIVSLGTTNFTTAGAASNTVGVEFVATAVPAGSGVVVDPYIPTLAALVMVTDERHVVAFGCNDAVGLSTTQDPMFIAWSSQEDPQVWAPEVTNTAGSYRLSYGSQIVTAEKTRQEILVWTDSALYSMRYLGAPYVYGFNVLSNEITIVSQNAAITANNITYWMGQDKFYAYSGRVDTLPCALRQYVFDDINSAQFDQIYCGTNEKYNEIWWFYPSADSDTNNRYVIYNYLEKLWYYGQLERTAWLDSHIQGNPFGATGQIVVQHENGTDDGSTNPVSAINAYIESADFDIGEGGNQFSFVKRIIPDVDFIGSTNTAPSVEMTLQARNYPGVGVNTQVMQTTTSTISGSKVSTQIYNYTDQVWVRLRGRQVIFRVESVDKGVKWQLGTPRLDLQPDGKR